MKEYATAMLEPEFQEEISFYKLVVSTLYCPPIGVRNTAERCLIRPGVWPRQEEENDELRTINGRTCSIHSWGCA